MSLPRPPSQPEGPLSWLEYSLIVILIIIVLAILLELFGPYLRLELVRICTENELPCDFLR
jgi:hypothetical protein